MPFAATRVLSCVIPFALMACPLLSKAEAPTSVDPLLRKIEARYNRSQSLKLDFSETYAGLKSPVQHDAGVLYLRKPGRMRWEYTTPAGKIFISDGKEVFLYTAGEPQAQKSKLRESADMRAPLAFLLGKLDFSKEFKSFQTRAVSTGAMSAIFFTAEPKSDNLAYTKVEFTATPEGQILGVNITGQNNSKLSFTFSNEQLNAPVTPAMFAFKAPPGVQIVDAEESQ
jgi:outer membrane lipoprotein carrier protein